MISDKDQTHPLEDVLRFDCSNFKTYVTYLYTYTIHENGLKNINISSNILFKISSQHSSYFTPLKICKIILIFVAKNEQSSLAVIPLREQKQKMKTKQGKLDNNFKK